MSHDFVHTVDKATTPSAQSIGYNWGKTAVVSARPVKLHDTRSRRERKQHEEADFYHEQREADHEAPQQHSIAESSNTFTIIEDGPRMITPSPEPLEHENSGYERAADISARSRSSAVESSIPQVQSSSTGYHLPFGPPQPSHTSSALGEETSMQVRRLPDVSGSRKRKLVEVDAPTPQFPAVEYGLPLSARTHESLTYEPNEEDEYDDGAAGCRPSSPGSPKKRRPDDVGQSWYTKHPRQSSRVRKRDEVRQMATVHTARKDRQILLAKLLEPRELRGPLNLDDITEPPIMPRRTKPFMYESREQQDHGEAAMSLLYPDARTSPSESHGDEILESTDGRPSFLTLPPELRNIIYDLTLFSTGNKDFTVTAASVFPEPPLLRTCTQIRTEAGSVFWQETNFRVNINDFNPTVLRRFDERLRSVSYRDKVQFGRTKHACFRRVWPNLLHWLKLYHKGERKHGMEYGVEDIVKAVCSCHQWEITFLKGLFIVAKGTRRQSWKATKAVLEWQRDNLLSAVNTGWTTT